MIELRLCSWQVASLTSEALAEIEREARGHGRGAAVIVSCQRIEVLHQTECSCSAPVRSGGVLALQRLAEVGAGLHSLVLGEAQVMGQVRTGLAQGGVEVRRAARLAIAAARQLRAEEQFELDTGQVLDSALEMTGPVGRARIAIAGAGTVGRLVARRALELGFEEVIVLGRRDPEGPWFDPLRMRFVPLDSLKLIEEIDVLVTCMGASAEPLTASDLPSIRGAIIDLGTPRNVQAEHSMLITIADMVRAGEAEMTQTRAPLRSRLAELLDKQLEHAALGGDSSVGRLRQEVERMRVVEVERIRRLHPALSRDTVDVITRSLVQQIFHRPTERLRQLEDPDLAERLAALFADEPSLELAR